MKSRGFTLIELLVVISIIGLLSSIVLAALNGARSKGYIANGESFSSNVFQTLGVNLQAGYDFNECNNNCTAIDSSINGYTLTAYGNATRENNNTYNGSGYALLLDGGSMMYNASPKNIPTGSVVSVTAWIYVTGYTDSTYNGIVSWGPRSCNGNAFLFSIQNTGRLSMATWCNDFVPSSGPSVPLNKWTNVAVTVNGTAVTFYINGTIAQSGTILSPNIQTGQLEIGCTDNPAGRCFVGAIDDVKIYSQAITAQDAYKIYALGATKHGIALK